MIDFDNTRVRRVYFVNKETTRSSAIADKPRDDYARAVNYETVFKSYKPP